MAINILDLQQLNTQSQVVTEEKLQNEFDYMMAQKMVENMFEKGLISQCEFNKISALNREKFSPELTSILATNT